MSCFCSIMFFSVSTDEANLFLDLCLLEQGLFFRSRHHAHSVDNPDLLRRACWCCTLDILTGNVTQRLPCIVQGWRPWQCVSCASSKPAASLWWVHCIVYPTCAQSLVCFVVRFSCSNSVSCLSFVLVIMTCSFTSFPPTPHPTPILCMCVCVCANVCVFRLRYIYAHAAGIDIVMLFCWRRNLCGLLCTGWGWGCVNTWKCVSVSIDILCTCCWYGCCFAEEETCAHSVWVCSCVFVVCCVCRLNFSALAMRRRASRALSTTTCISLWTGSWGYDIVSFPYVGKERGSCLVQDWDLGMWRDGVEGGRYGGVGVERWSSLSGWRGRRYGGEFRSWFQFYWREKFSAVILQIRFWLLFYWYVFSC